MGQTSQRRQRGEYRSAAHQARRQGILALSLGLLLSCTRADVGQPEAPFGGSLSAPLPYADVLGFLRLRPAAGEWSLEGLLGTQSQSKGMAPFRALGELMQLVGSLPSVRRGAPLAVVFLDPQVHGGGVGVVLEGTLEQLQEHLAGLSMLEFDVERSELRLKGLQALGAWQSLLGSLSPGSGGSGPGAGSTDPSSFLPTQLAVRESGGRLFLLPSALGLRNVRATLEVTGALDPAGGDGEFVRLKLQHVVADARAPLLQALALPLTALAFRQKGKMDLAQVGAIQRRVQEAVHQVFDLLEGSRQIFFQRERGGGGYQIYIQAEPESLLSAVFRMFPQRPLAGWIPTVERGELVASLAVDPGALGEYLRRCEAQRRQRVGAEEDSSETQTQAPWVDLCGETILLRADAGQRSELQVSTARGRTPQQITTSLRQAWQAIGEQYGSLLEMLDLLPGPWEALPQPEGGLIVVQGVMTLGVAASRWFLTVGEGHEARARARLSGGIEASARLPDYLPESASGFVVTEFGPRQVWTLEADAGGLYLGTISSGL